MNWLVPIWYFCAILSIGNVNFKLIADISFDTFDFQKRRAKCKFFPLLWRPGRLLTSRDVQKKCTYALSPSASSVGLWSCFISSLFSYCCHKEWMLICGALTSFVMRMCVSDLESYLPFHFLKLSFLASD